MGNEVLSIRDRVYDIKAKVKGDFSGISEFEQKVLNNIENYSNASNKQREILGGIEKKVFDESR